MRIQHITENKENYLDVLLLAGFSEDKTEEQLKTGELFVLTEDNIIKTACIVEMLKNRNCVIKNIATIEEERGKGFGRHMINYVCEHFNRECDTIHVGTDVGAQDIAFYKRCGFEEFRSGTEVAFLKRPTLTDVSVNKVVDMAAEAGRILLKNGAEIFRVEETITRICNRFHIDKVDVFTLSHAIFISAEREGEEAYTKVKNVPLSSPHLGIVAEVNELSREIAAGYVTVDKANERLKEIDAIKPVKAGYQILGAAISAGPLGYLLGATMIESIIAFVIGGLIGAWQLVSKKYNISRIITNIVGGIIMTSAALLAQQLHLFGMIHLEGIIAGAIMPLVPGVSFVNAIRDIADGDFLAGTVKMINALMVFVYIALGVGITLNVFQGLLGGLSLW